MSGTLDVDALLKALARSDWDAAYHIIAANDGWVLLLIALGLAWLLFREALATPISEFADFLIEIVTTPFVLIYWPLRDLRQAYQADRRAAAAAKTDGGQPSPAHSGPGDSGPTVGGQTGVSGADNETVVSQAAPQPVLQTAGCPPAEGNHPAQARAEGFLRRRLAGGPAPAAEILAEADTLGISLITLKRAKAALGIRSTKKGITWLWELPKGE